MNFFMALNCSRKGSQSHSLNAAPNSLFAVFGRVLCHVQESDRRVPACARLLTGKTRLRIRWF